MKLNASLANVTEGQSLSGQEMALDLQSQDANPHSDADGGMSAAGAESAGQELRGVDMMPPMRRG